ncbi:MAG: C40 family peptidase [Gemmatimonadales bacterium]|nr:C40 family peptidase [Gemmatimonadales bacterium]
MFVIVRAAIAPITVQPSLRAEQVSQLVLGETATLEERAGDWRRVRCDHDGYSGWIHAGYLLESDGVAAQRWRRDASGWSFGATLAAEGQRVRLPLRARVALDDGKVRLPDGRRAELVEGHLVQMGDVTAAARAQPPERWALECFDGAPYEWGGVTPWGVDCSGLVQTTFAARGVAFPRDAALQVDLGEVVQPGAHRPGDLLFFRGDGGDRITHVAFAAEADTLIHSTVSCGGVLVEPWLPGTRAAVLRERLVAVRRLEQR